MRVKLEINPKKYNLVLGIGSNHDFSGCLVQDGRIYRAIEAERISKLKHSLGAFNPFKSILKYLFPNGEGKIGALATCDTLNLKFHQGYENNIKLYNHHLCHAAAVYYTSPFRKSAIFVADGMGSCWETADGGYKYETYSYYFAEGRKINLLKKQFGQFNDSLDETHIHHIYIPNSLGLFYNYITKIIGFSFLDDGKTMGLSAYGDPNRFYKEIIELFEFKKEGMVNNIFGKKEVDYYSSLISSVRDEKKQFQLKADLAASAQRILEECYFFCLNHLYKKTKCENLCLSGGVVLNSVANGKIRRETPFKNIHYFPACGDDSIAVGAAFLAYYGRRYSKRSIIWQTPFLGEKYSEREIELELKRKSVSYHESSNIAKEVAKFIARGKVVGWFQGGSEFGPRALGHRSILADPRCAEMKDILNRKVKHREFFRPFGSSVLEEYASEYFEYIKGPSPYMLEVFPIKKDKQKEIPSVVHRDGTGRVQTVGKNNGDFYRLIREFHKLTNIPVILNTSFNAQGQPIVETPRDAVDCFLSTEIDILVIGTFVCRKSG